MAEITAINAFVDSFMDHDLRKQVLHKRPATLAEALTWAICIEAIDDRAKHGITDTHYDKEGRRDDCKPHRAHAQSATSTPSKPPSSPSERPWKRDNRSHTPARSASQPRHQHPPPITDGHHSDMSTAAIRHHSPRKEIRCFNCDGR